jgi:hypothetical protein
MSIGRAGGAAVTAALLLGGCGSDTKPQHLAYAVRVFVAGASAYDLPSGPIQMKDRTRVPSAWDSVSVGTTPTCDGGRLYIYAAIDASNFRLTCEDRPDVVLFDSRTPNP